MYHVLCYNVSIGSLNFKKENKLKIQIVTKTLTTKPTARGSYQELEVVYKNLTFGGKVESKKLMSFGASNASFTTLSASADGSVWEVTVFKNDKGFNDWPDVTPAGGEVAAATAGTALDPRTKPTANTTKSTYETSEERAQRQVLIVRQSSASTAGAVLSAGAKTPPKIDDVIAAAKKLENYVFGLDEPTAQASATGFDGLPDFEVEVN